MWNIFDDWAETNSFVHLVLSMDNLYFLYTEIQFFNVYFLQRSIIIQKLSCKYNSEMTQKNNNEIFPVETKLR